MPGVNSECHSSKPKTCSTKAGPALSEQILVQLARCTRPTPCALFLAAVSDHWRHSRTPAFVSSVNWEVSCWWGACFTGITLQSAQGPACSCSPWGPLQQPEFLGFGWAVLVLCLCVCFVGESGRGGILRKGKEISSALLKMEIRNYQFRVSRSHSAWLPSTVLLWNDFA